MSETFDSSELLTRCYRVFEVANPTEPEDIFMPKCLGKKFYNFHKKTSKIDFSLLKMLHNIYFLYFLKKNVCS